MNSSRPELGDSLERRKRYAEIPPALEKAIAAYPGNEHLRVLRVTALFRTQAGEVAITEAKALAGSTASETTLNDLAYTMADVGQDFSTAEKWSRMAIARTEQRCANASLADLKQEDLGAVNMLAAEWDTLGWIYFRGNHLRQAESYTAAAWALGQQRDVANHPGQIYKKRGRSAEAIHLWRLSLSSGGDQEEVRERLRKAGASAAIATQRSGGSNVPTMSGGEELGRLRTVDVPDMPTQTGSEEFFILLTRAGIENVQLIGSPGTLKSSTSALQKVKYAFPFPDESEATLIRRGILSCSSYTTPSCQFTMLLPSMTTVTDSRMPPRSVDTKTLPILRNQVEPQYTPAAIEAKLEGTVRLILVIDDGGVPVEATVVNSLGSGLDESAKQCVLKWRFSPATKNGKPVRTTATVDVNFRLSQEPASTAKAQP